MELEGRLSTGGWFLSSVLSEQMRDVSTPLRRQRLFFMRRTSYWSVWVIHLVLSHVSCGYKKFSDMELHNFLLLGILELKKLLGFFLSFLVYSFAVVYVFSFFIKIYG